MDRIDQAISFARQSPTVVKIERRVQRYENDPDWSWTSGGCFAFAEALVKAIIGAELWAVGQFQGYDWATQHAFVCVDAKFYDADGLTDREALLKKYGWSTSRAKLGRVKHWADEKPLWYPDQEFVTPREINRIARVVRFALI